jgi:ATP-dependent DNA helicase RecQ
MLRGYAETTAVDGSYYSGVGQQLDEPCGNCDSCDAGEVRNGDHVGGPSVTPFGANSLVRHDSWGDGVVMSAANDRLTVLFDAGGYKTLSTKAIDDGKLWRPLTHGAA